MERRQPSQVRWWPFGVKGVRSTLDFAVTGTKNEELLRVLTGRADKKISLHVCGPDCGALVTDELLVNAHAFEQVDLGRLPCLTNLKKDEDEYREEDELAKQRQEQKRVEAEKERMEKHEKKREKKRRKKRGGEVGLPSPRRRSWRLVRKVWRVSSETRGWIQIPNGVQSS